MAIPFLPEASIVPIFQRLRVQVTTPVLQQFVRYVAETWSPCGPLAVGPSSWFLSVQTIIWKGGTTASTDEQTEKPNFCFTLWLTFFTKRPGWLLYKSSSSRRVNFPESRGANTASYRLDSLLTGTNLAIMTFLLFACLSCVHT